MDNTNYGVSFNKPFIGIFMKKTSINKAHERKTHSNDIPL